MTDRLQEIVQKALADTKARFTADTEVGYLTERLREAGVTLPPEPEIPVPDEAVAACKVMGWGVLQSETIRKLLRESYPHIVAAVIDAMPTAKGTFAGGEAKYVHGGTVYASDLHRALKSAKATP